MAQTGPVIEITPKTLANQWRNLRHKFEVNVFEFENAAGDAAVDVFKGSFELQKFNTRGAMSWPSRKNPKSNHPLLRETGTLQKSIKSKRLKSVGLGGVIVYTDPGAFGSAARHKGFCYAAIHNEGGIGAHATGAAAHIRKRQFIGDSTVLREKLKQLEVKIFKSFPQ